MAYFKAQFRNSHMLAIDSVVVVGLLQRVFFVRLGYRFWSRKADVADVKSYN